MTRRIRNTLLTITLIAAAVLYGPAVWAQEDTRWEIPIETVFKGDPGDLFLEGTFSAMAGDECVAALTFGNNPAEEPSIHLGNDILVGPVTFTNVENGMFEAAALTFIATGNNDVAVRLGADGVFSGGFTLEVTCNPPTTTTTSTTTPEPTTTTPVSPPTTVPPAPPTTLSPPPVGGVDTGGGGCADGACDGFSLSPLATWTLYIAAWLITIVGLSTFIAIVNRKED